MVAASAFKSVQKARNSYRFVTILPVSNEPYALVFTLVLEPAQPRRGGSLLLQVSTEGQEQLQVGHLIMVVISNEPIALAHMLLSFLLFLNLLNLVVVAASIFKFVQKVRNSYRVYQQICQAKKPLFIFLEIIFLRDRISYT